MLFEWFGDNVQNEMDVAVQSALNETAADAVAHAQRPPHMGGAPVVIGWLSSNITWEPARRREDGSGQYVRWGNLYEPDYALIVSLRNPYLQRNADIVYPRLEERIQRNLPPWLRS